MVKKNDAPKGPKIVRGEPAKKVPAKKAGAATREALASDVSSGAEQGEQWKLGAMTSEQASQPDKAPKEGDTRRDEVNDIDLVYRDGRWIPAAGQKFTGGTADMDLEAPPASSGWGSGIDVSAANEEDEGIAGDQRDDPPAPDDPPDTGKVGWGLNGQQQIVDEEGGDASEAGKVSQARKDNAAKPKGDEDAEGVNLTGMAKDLIAIVERAERVLEEISAGKDDLKEIIAEAKQKGYSTKILRKVLARRAMDPDKRKEEDSLLGLYEEAINGA